MAGYSKQKSVKENVLGRYLGYFDNKEDALGRILVDELKGGQSDCVKWLPMKKLSNCAFEVDYDGFAQRVMNERGGIYTSQGIKGWIIERLTNVFEDGEVCLIKHGDASGNQFKLNQFFYDGTSGTAASWTG